MGTTLSMVKGDNTRDLIEGHPIGIRKIIQGDLRTRTVIVNGETKEISVGSGDGILLYDSMEVKHRPWFVLVYESGSRVID